VRRSGETIEDVSSVVAGPPPTPTVVLVALGTEVVHKTFALGDQPLLVGRVGAVGDGVELDDERVSRQHASIERRARQWIVRDLGSRNGTFLDGERLQGDAQASGDRVVRVGHSVLLLLEDGRGHERAPRDNDEAVIGPELARLYEDVRRHATAPTLLVHGESGSGKELAARLYHEAGPRAAGPFVAVNCAAIPEGVAERLLFGAKKGAFSGATDAVGYVQSADGGTLFLDEVAELDAAVQAKLLRVLETREVIPVGAAGGVKVDVGVVAATHRDLRVAVAERRFRDDLYYRLARPAVVLPALRHRRADIPRLVARELAGVDRTIAAHSKLIEACCVRPWPGNVRELRHALHEAAGVAQAAGRDVVRPEDLPQGAGLPVRDRTSVTGTGTRSGHGHAAAPAPAPAPAPPQTELTKDQVIAALATAGGNVSAAARSLGLHRTQLYRMMERFGIGRDPQSTE
jgi:transcriptional regulator with PAS, ATPase and Fis domain